MNDPTLDHWWEDREQLARLAFYLLDQMRADEIPHALLSPWRYEQEYREAFALVNA